MAAAPARAVAFRILSQIAEGGKFSDDLLNSPMVNRLHSRDRDLVTEVVYGCLRMQLWLDSILASKTNRRFSSIDSRAVVLLRMALYQICFLHRVPAYAAIHDAVELARGTGNRGLPSFVNAILRSLQREQTWAFKPLLNSLPPWVQVSLPEWIWRRWETRFGIEAAAKYARSLNLPPQRVVRADYRGSEIAGGQESDIVPGARILDERSSSAQVPLQDEASQLIAFLLPDPGIGMIWDACAAPGGKTAILAHRFGERVQIVATELRLKRALVMQQALLERKCAAHISLVVADATQVAWRTGFRAVLVDAPCSGLGTLRRNPEIRWRFRPEAFARLQAMQSAILQAAADYVEPGGYLLYSTCSTEPEENESVIERFLNRRPEFTIRPPSGPPQAVLRIGSDGFLRTFPSERRWDGFFAALMQRQR